MLPALDLFTLLSKLVFYVLLIVFILHVAFVGHHWYAYGTNTKLAALTTFAYLILGGACILVMGAVAFN